MSRTIKDIPYHVIRQQAYNHGFIDTGGEQYARYRHHANYDAFDVLLSVLIVVDGENMHLFHDWLNWVKTVRRDYELSYRIDSNVCNVTSAYDDEPSQPKYDVAMLDVGRELGREYRSKRYLGAVDGFWNEFHPGGFALNVNQSVRNAGIVNVITVDIVLYSAASRWRTENYRAEWLADVDEYVRTMHAHDRHYNRGALRRHHHDIEEKPSRPRVRDELIHVRNSYNSCGRLDDDYDASKLDSENESIDWFD